MQGHLCAKLALRIKESGPMTFKDFMEAALYAPGLGYYVSGKEKWGRGGDYITSLDVSPVFGLAMATQVWEMWLVMGSPRRFTVIEAGGGRGWLTGWMLDAFSRRYPELFEAVEAVIIEKNPDAASRGILPEFANKVSFCDDIFEAVGRSDVSIRSAPYPKASGRFEGVVISNELMDSIPFHRVIKRNGSLKEIYVGIEDGRFIEVAKEPSTKRLGEHFSRLGIELSEAQRGEVSLGACDWIRGVGEKMARGFVVTIDYGASARLLYGEVKDGSVLCYYRHTVNSDPYRNVGEQDITCMVDFSSLKATGLEAGLEVSGFTAQRNFLLGLGVLDELKEIAEPSAGVYGDIVHNQGIKELIMPGGIGDTMKALVQRKGVPASMLAGFSFKDTQGQI
ncbi:MAG: SAM-dependent methyltransferase [Thermodesulfobacteriota bacterium]